MSVSSTTASLEMPMTTSNNAASIEAVTVHHEATTSTGTGVTIDQRIAVHPPSHRALESSARPSAFGPVSPPNDTHQV
jgi:hypothetical protein